LPCENVFPQLQKPHGGLAGELARQMQLSAWAGGTPQVSTPLFFPMGHRSKLIASRPNSNFRNHPRAPHAKRIRFKQNFYKFGSGPKGGIPHRERALKKLSWGNSAPMDGGRAILRNIASCFTRGNRLEFSPRVSDVRMHAFWDTGKEVSSKTFRNPKRVPAPKKPWKVRGGISIFKNIPARSLSRNPTTFHTEPYQKNPIL